MYKVKKRLDDPMNTINPDLKNLLQAWDDRRDLIIPGDKAATIEFSIQHFIALAKKAISDHGSFAVALSGGSTPNAIYQGLTRPEYLSAIDWSRVLCFWSDERCVPKDHPDSNYNNAMKAGLSKLPLNPNHIFPMDGIGDLEKNSEAYEKLLLDKLSGQIFDLVMLGMGEDGHTASLFPKTHGLHPNERLAIPNYIPQKECWRMTLTFDCINAARHINLYVLGESKAQIVKQVLTGPYDPDMWPVQRIGVPDHKALWILDNSAGSALLQK